MESAGTLGEFIRTQRQMANLSIRELARVARVSNPYLSQVERGIYRPSADVLKAIAGALGMPVEALFARAGLIDGSDPPEGSSVEDAIRRDRRLPAEKKDALLRVYRSFLETTDEGGV